MVVFNKNPLKILFKFITRLDVNCMGIFKNTNNRVIENKALNLEVCIAEILTN